MQQAVSPCRIFWFLSHDGHLTLQFSVRLLLTNRQSRVRFSDTLSLLFQVTFGVPQGSILGPFLLIFVDDLCNSINHCIFFTFADDLRIIHVIDSPHDYLLLQCDINSVSDWGAGLPMRLNIAKTRVVSYSRKTNVLSISFVMLPLYSSAALRI
jgi:hypothetical protein